MTFRRRLIGAVVAITMLTCTIVSALVCILVDRDQRKQLDGALLAEAREEAGEAATLGGAKLAISEKPGPMANDVGPLTKYGAIYDTRSGAVLASTPTFHDAPPTYADLRHAAGDCFDLWIAREHLRGVFVSVPGKPDFALLLAAPRTDLDDDANFLLRAVVIASLASVLWASILATWLVGRLTRGHARVAEVARRVAEGDLSARVPVVAGEGEVVQLAHDVNGIIDRLSALLSSQQAFIAHAAHELRTPLTTLFGELSLALRRPRDNDGYRSAIEEAMESTRRLRALADDLLALARLGTTLDPPSQEVSVPTILGQAIRTVDGEIAERAVRVEVSGTCRTIVGRPLDLERLFRNLIENAVRHSPRGGRVAVELEEPSAREVLVAVRDEGPGVAPDDRARIFEPFYRGPRATVDDSPGSGLGLAIARRIAGSHGGDVTLDPTVERGARFVVRLSA